MILLDELYEEVRASFEAGADQVLPKPFVPGALVGAIKACAPRLRRRQRDPSRDTDRGLVGRSSTLTAVSPRAIVSSRSVHATGSC